MSKKLRRMLKLQGAVPKNTNCLFLSARALDHSSYDDVVNFIIPQQAKEKAKKDTIFCVKSCIVRPAKSVSFIPLTHVVEEVGRTHEVFKPTLRTLDELMQACYGHKDYFVENTLL